MLNFLSGDICVLWHATPSQPSLIYHHLSRLKLPVDSLNNNFVPLFFLDQLSGVRTQHSIIVYEGVSRQFPVHPSSSTISMSVKSQRQPKPPLLAWYEVGRCPGWQIPTSILSPVKPKNNIFFNLDGKRAEQPQSAKDFKRPLTIFTSGTNPGRRRHPRPRRR